MDFLLITLAIMSVSILLIYKITNFCGLQLKFQALVLCALLAFVVNFSTLAISAYLTQEHFFLIAGLVLASAVAVTMYNERLLHRQPAPETIAAPAGAALTLPLKEEPAMPEAPAAEAEPAAAAAAMQAKDIPLPAAAIPADEAESEETASAAEVPAISIEPPVSPSAQEIPEETAAPEETAPEAQAPSAARIYPFRRASRIRGQRRRRRPLLPACLIRTVAEIVQEDMENDQLLQLTAVLAKLGSLDDILNYAFEQTSRHNYSNALFAYKQALSRYHADSYAPFIVIEMGNIYKNNGAYEDAIHAYRNALTLPAVAASTAIHEEFTKNVDYLRIVQLILARHSASRTSFDKIPATWRNEIELVFKKRHPQKSVS